MTLEDMADALGVTQRAYWNYENNRVPFGRLREIAEITGAEFEWLLRGDPPQRMGDLTTRLEALEAEVHTSSETTASSLEALLRGIERLEARLSDEGEQNRSAR